METKICPICNIDKPLDKFGFNNRGIGESYYNRVCVTCTGRRTRAKLKLEFLDAFGSKCACCDEDDPRFLSLDHINNDGKKHRASFGDSSNTHRVLQDAKREGWPKDKYQCLCYNCNMGRAKFKGICPHKLKSKDEYKEELKKLVRDFRQEGLTLRRKIYGSVGGSKPGRAKTGGRVAQDPRIKVAKMLGITVEQLDALMKQHGG